MSDEQDRITTALIGSNETYIRHYNNNAAFHFKVNQLSSTLSLIMEGYSLVAERDDDAILTDTTELIQRTANMVIPGDETPRYIDCSFARYIPTTPTQAVKRS